LLHLCWLGALNSGSRFTKRLGRLKVLLPEKINTDVARILELQRLLAPTMAAKWIVMKVIGDQNLIINDNGYIPYWDSPFNQSGYALPLTQNYILGILPNLQKPIAYMENNTWYPVILYADLESNDQLGFNKISIEYAKNFIYGDTKALLEIYSRPKNQEVISLPEPIELDSLLV